MSRPRFPDIQGLPPLYGSVHRVFQQLSPVYPSLLAKDPSRWGDRVRTAHGKGIIIEIDGEKYLVALDAQEGRLWEKEWGLKKP